VVLQLIKVDETYCPPTKRRKGKCTGEMVDHEPSTVHSGTHWASVFQNLSYSVHALCQPVHIYSLFINSIILTDYIMIMARIVQKIMQMFLACIVCARDLGTWLAFCSLEDSTYVRWYSYAVDNFFFQNLSYDWQIYDGSNLIKITSARQKNRNRSGNLASVTCGQTDRRKTVGVFGKVAKNE